MSKDAAVIKALTELGLRKESEFTLEQEEMFQRVISPETFFRSDVEKLFKDEYYNEQ